MNDDLDMLQVCALISSLREAGADPAFCDRLRTRMADGQREYEGGSFDLSYSTILDELECEFVDIAGWLIVLGVKIQRSVKLSEVLHENHPKVRLMRAAKNLAVRASHALVSAQVGLRGDIQQLESEDGASA